MSGLASTTTRLLALFATVLPLLVVTRAEAQAGRALARTVERRAMARFAGREMAAMLRRDAARDARLTVRALPKTISTHRYVSGKSILGELTEGLRTGAHTTSRALPGRPLGALSAQRKLGLPEAPGWRLRIEWPKGWPVRKAKALGGKPGVGEITSPRALPRSAVKGAVRLR